MTSVTERIFRHFVATIACVVALACHEAGDVKVASLSFTGNHAFKGSALSKLLVTQATGKLPWAKPRYFNRQVFEADLQRLTGFYVDRGYPEARVASMAVDFTPKRDAVHLRVEIEEGAPLLVEAVEVTGLDAVPEPVRADVSEAAVKTGVARDRQVVAASRERMAFLLRDNGYAHARVATTERAGTQPHTVIVTFAAQPGPETRFGETTIVNANSVHESVVRRSLSFKMGDSFRESAVLESQRRLRGLGVFDFAHVKPKETTLGNRAAPEALPMVVTVTEGKPQRFQVGLGYGSEDGPRGSLEWEHVNLFKRAQQLAINSRYSLRLRGAGVDFTQPYFFAPRLSLFASVGMWRTDEPIYLSRTRGGRVGVSYRHLTGRGGEVEAIERRLRFSYSNDYLSYNVNPEIFGNLTFFEQLIALGLDPLLGQGKGRVAALNFEGTRQAVDRRIDPHRGYTLNGRFVHATPWLGGDFRYDEVDAEGRVYFALGDGPVLASRARVAALLARDDTSVPFSERYFLGGLTSLRGWGRFQVAPLTEEGLPIGGRALVDLSTELRFSLRSAIGVVVFVDAGQVWGDSDHFASSPLLVAAGPGVRWLSPVGIVRFDAGFQLRHLPGLVVNGEPETRHWRIHFSIGHTF